MLFRRFRKKKDEIRTRKLTIEDAAGKARITAEVDHEDNASVCFYDDAGRDKLVLSLSTDGTPRVGLRYADNHGLILIEANESQKTPSIVITGPAGNAQIVLGVAGDTTPIMVSMDAAGNIISPLYGPRIPTVPQAAGASDGIVEDEWSCDWDGFLRDLD